jgi:hypothetical protein
MRETEYRETAERARRQHEAFMLGAESGMVEVRGYGLTPEEWAEAGQVARELYPEYVSELVA